MLVETGSRLHAGFYYAAGDWNIRWGSAGFYVDRPSFRATVTESSEPCVKGPSYVADLAARAAEAVGIKGYCVEVSESIPEHVGLGSGTQTLLALHRAFQLLQGREPEPAVDTALRLGRARESAVGTLLFEMGGFVMDAGLPSRPKPLLRLPVPEQWRFLVLLPELPRGLSDDEERSIMERPWGNPESNVGIMTSGALRLASGLARGDIDDVLEGLRLMQRGTGFYFSSIQGGIFRGPLNDLAAETWRHRIILAQSSWGPVMYTIVENEYEAEGDVALLKETMREVGIKGNVIIARPRNVGATILIDSS